LLGLNLSKRGVAEALDVSSVTVDRWVSRGCPVLERGAKGKRWVLDLAAVVEWLAERRAAGYGPPASRSKATGGRSCRTPSPEAVELLDGLVLSLDQMIPWQHGDVVTVTAYQEQIGIDADEWLYLVALGMPYYPPAAGETVGRVSIPHAERFRGLLSCFVEGLGGDGTATNVATQAMRLCGRWKE
jgi:hypothetical protein